MLKIAKEFSFDIAHMLDGHDGKCKNLHGHTYRLQVEVGGPLHASGPKAGMVMDYADLKDIVKHHRWTTPFSTTPAARANAG